MILLEGKPVAKKIENEIARAVEGCAERKPGLAFLIVGDNPASRTYVQMKKKRCAEVGIQSHDYEFPQSTPQKTLIEKIELLNHAEEIDGILVQLPLPDHIDPFAVISAIAPHKDVDGFHPENAGKLLLGDPTGFIPCTPHGIHILLNHYQIPLLGKHVVIVGRSNIVGKPLAALLMQKAPHCNATVTIVHSLSENLKEHCRSADILIAAIGKPSFIQADMVKKGATVIDVGINRLSTGIIVGDVDYQQVAPLCSHITPVPGGIGPMTIALLLSNTLLSYQRRSQK